VAALASILVRIGRFKRMLLARERTLNRGYCWRSGFSIIFGAGVLIRVGGPQYKAV